MGERTTAKPEDIMKLQPVEWDEYTKEYANTHIETIEAFAKAHDLHAPIHIEIGSNRGRFVTAQAELNPGVTHLGIEYKRSLCRKARGRIERAGLKNAFILDADVKLALPMLFPDGSLDRVYILFPDPWWKKKHGKRRLNQLDFLALLANKLKPGGELILKTDVEPYAEISKDTLALCTFFDRLEPGQEGYPDESNWPMTTRERHITAANLPIWKLYYRRNDAPVTIEGLTPPDIERYAKPHELED